MAGMRGGCKRCGVAPLTALLLWLCTQHWLSLGNESPYGHDVGVLITDACLASQHASVQRGAGSGHPETASLGPATGRVSIAGGCA